MELVYLWIEEYKNIENQGFNFSPRFECEYENGELIIKEKDYQSIFPNNINVTAIVGKNGAGKSNLLELFLFVLKDREYVNDIKYILIFKKDKLYYKFNNIKIKNLNNETSFQIENIDDRFENNLILNIEHNLILYTKNNLLYKKLIKEQKLRDYENFYIKFPYFLNQINKYNECINKIKFNIFFNKFVLDINLFNIDRFYNEIQEDNHYIALSIQKFINNFLQLENTNPLQKIKKQNLFEKKIIGVDSVLFYNAILSFLHFIYQNREYIKNQEIIQEIIQEIEKVINISNFLLNKVFEIVNMIIFDTDDIDFNKYLKSQIKTFTEFFKYLSLIQPEFSIIVGANTSFQYNIDIDENKKITNIILNTYKLIYFDEDFMSNFVIDYINYDFWYTNENDNIILKYNDLSNGEKTILTTISDIIYYINNHKEAKIILFDEIDETLHPEWKRKLFDILFCLFKKLQRSFHLIFTTHSPFLLSDIPKENIIFLEDGKQVDVDIDTFGANIHTLLTHGFFMNDGLMGEFAKSKINEVIKFLNGDKESKIKNNNEAQYIINIIGEPIIKRQLQKKLDSKRLSKIDEIRQIEREMRMLKNRVKELENDKNNNN